MELQYPDLPAWAQPGQKAVAITSNEAVRVTIDRVTKAQIVVKNNNGYETRCDRVGTAPDPSGLGDRGRWWDVRFRVRGRYSQWLVSPDEPEAHAIFFRQGLIKAVREATEAGEKAGREISRGLRKVPRNADLEQWAMESLDELENAVRAARKMAEKTVQRHGERASLHWSHGKGKA